MGMYASGPYVEDLKLTGLLATLMVECAQQKFLGEPYEGVELTEDGYIAGGVVTLTRAEVQDIVWEMRKRLLDGHARSCNAWATCMKEQGIGHHEMPLVSLQDILTYEKDVHTFTMLAHWCAHTQEGIHHLGLTPRKGAVRETETWTETPLLHFTRKETDHAVHHLPETGRCAGRAGRDKSPQCHQGSVGLRRPHQAGPAQGQAGHRQDPDR